MTKKALKLALEALEGVLDDAPKVLEASIAGGLYEVVQCRDAITAIKEALAQPEQEPVAWGCNRYIEDDKGFQIGTDDPELAWGKYAPDDNGWWPLYTSPSAQRILELEALLERQTARIVDLQTHIENLEGEDR